MTDVSLPVRGCSRLSRCERAYWSDMATSISEEIEEIDRKQNTEVASTGEFPPEYLIKHPLQNTWTLWYYEPDRNKSWEESQREITSFDTAEDFWSLYNHIKTASELRQGCDYSMFKQGIRPMWEDDQNKCGGRWLINLDKKQRATDLDNFWLEILLCMIGEAFNEYSDDVCGAVVNVRPKGDKLGIWTSNADCADSVMEIGRKLKERLRITSKTTMGYQDIGVNIITEQAVVDEITSKRQLRRLVVLPYDLKIQEVFTENVKFVTEFAKKSGDYISLSATDIKVIALTYQLEKEKVGTAHLKDAPTIRTVKSAVEKESDDPKLPVGFYLPKKKEKKELDVHNKNVEISSNNTENTNVIEENITHVQIVSDSATDNTKNDVEKQFTSYASASSEESQSDYETASDNEEEKKLDEMDLIHKFSKLEFNPADLDVEGKYVVDDILAPVVTTSKSDESLEDEDDEDNDTDDDDDGWITPANVSNVKRQMDSEILEEKAATVACLTMDFAMQNVLMQMGLNVVALDGRVIKQMRTFIFRCYACFKTTSVMTKIFCPHCGNRTLKKVEVTLDGNGKQQIHINFRRPLSARGKKFSLPMPKGGKHANNPILCEDQPMPDQRPSRLARMKNNPLDDDYIAGYSPFVMRDINSKSAMLGIRPDGAVKYWMKRNPNESKKKRK